MWEFALPEQVCVPAGDMVPGTFVITSTFSFSLQPTLVVFFLLVEIEAFKGQLTCSRS